MNKFNSAIIENINDTRDLDELCAVCNSKIDYEEELSSWIKCESCYQGFHGNHFLEKGIDGYCPSCLGPLLVGIDMESYKITGIVSGHLQFQLRKRSIDHQSSGALSMLPVLFIIASFFLVFLFAGLAATHS